MNHIKSTFFTINVWLKNINHMLFVVLALFLQNRLPQIRQLKTQKSNHAFVTIKFRVAKVIILLSFVQPYLKMCKE